MKRFLHNLYSDDRGAISVLTILTIWCLVALLAMLWNTAEYARQRRDVQNAADSAAQASATWVSRTLNTVAGQNMAICRDASAEAVWRAAIITAGDPVNDPQYPNSGSLYRELARELTDAQNKRSPLRGLQARINALHTRIEIDYTLTQQALDSLAANGVGTYPAGTPNQPPIPLATKVRQAQSALNWVENTYLNGNASPAYRPGAPGPNGEGLYTLMQNWYVAPATETQIFELIIDYINSGTYQGRAVELPLVRELQNQTYPATSQPVDQLTHQHEALLFQQQENERDATPLAIDQQVHRQPSSRPADPQNVEDFYNVNVTLLTTKQQEDEPTVTDTPNAQPLGLADSGTASAPVATPPEADGSAGLNYTDTIRAKYPLDAAAAGLPITFDIDPINPHTVAHTSMDVDGASQKQWEDARIWHPDVTIPWGLGSYTIRCNVPGGWGHIWLMPLARYLVDRIYKDQGDIHSKYMDVLDNSRWTESDTGDLAHQIWKLQNLPPDPKIASLPGSLRDDVQNTTGGYDQIRVLPTLKNPTGANAATKSLIITCNARSASYISDVNELRQLLLLYVSAFVEYYQPFAVLRWEGAVDTGRSIVMGENPSIPGLPQQGTYSILASYKLRKIPAWAQSGMRAAVQEQVYNYILYMNLPRMVNPWDRSSVSNAIALLRATAWEVAGEIADEWVNRPWPYEVAPPGEHTPASLADSDPPSKLPAGLAPDDRQKFFSSIAWAQAKAPPRTLLSKIFGNTAPLAAYAQSEAFDWMEFNPSYGGEEQFDVPTPTVNYMWAISDFKLIGCPRAWRLCSVGGQNWQPRLSFADALSDTLMNNTTLQTSIPVPSDPHAYDRINLH